VQGRGTAAMDRRGLRPRDDEAVQPGDNKK